MASTIMRNRVTTEYRKVERDSEEYYLLRSELHADGRPRWEQTGEHDLRAFEQRKAEDALLPTDRGDGDPVPLLGITAAGAFMPPPRGTPTPGEIEQGAGRAAEDPQDDVTDEVFMNTAIAGVIEGTASPGDPGVEAETGTMEDLRTEGSASSPSSPDSGDDEVEQTGDSYDTTGYDDLKAEVNDRGLEVTGSGNGGRVLKSDMVSALRADDASKSEQGDTPA